MKRIIVLLAFITLGSYLYSQSSLSFCAFVEQNGDCVFNNTKFIASPDSTSQKILMQLKSGDTPFETTKAIFKIYTVDKKGKEMLETTLEQNIEEDWIYSWMPYIFKTPATYNVKIFNDTEEIMCSNSFELMDFKALH